MGQYNGKIPENAEICIDYTKKKVSFYYPYKHKNKDNGYRHNTLYSFVFCLLGLSIGIIYVQRIAILYAYSSAYSIIDPLTFTYCLLLWFYLFIIFFTLTVGSSFSYFIHKYSKIARKNYPKTNDILGFLRKRRMIDFSEKYGKRHYIDNNKLVIMDYNIVCFKYTLITKNKLKKIYTKSVSKTKKEHYKFICFFEFFKPIKEGYLIYK